MGVSHPKGFVLAGCFSLLLTLGTAIGDASAASAGWSSPQDLSDSFEVGVLEGSALNYPDIDVSDGGDAVAIWRRQEQLPNLTYREDIWTRDRPLGGDWGAARLVGTGNGDVSDPRVATNAGTTVIAWQSGTDIVAQVRRRGGDYAELRNFGDGAEVQVGVDAAGAATVLWSGGGVAYGIRSARYVPGSGWGSTKTISFSPTAQTPDLAVSDDGDAIAAWKAQDGVRVTEFTPAGGWTSHHLVAAGGLRPSIAANRVGQVVLAWAQPGPPDTPLAPTDSVRAMTGTVRDGLGAAKQLSDDILWDLWLDEPIPEAAIGDGGDAVVAWNRAVSIYHDATIQVSTPPAAFT